MIKKKKHDKASGKPHCAIANWHLTLLAKELKRKGQQRYSSIMMLAMYVVCSY